MRGQVPGRAITILDFHYMINMTKGIHNIIVIAIYYQISDIRFTVVCFVSFLANELHSKYECKDVARESIITVCDNSANKI